MARSREELYEMLDRADRAGDTAAARDIYSWIQETPEAAPTPAPKPTTRVPDTTVSTSPAVPTGPVREGAGGTWPAPEGGATGGWEPTAGDIAKAGLHGLRRVGKGLSETGKMLGLDKTLAGIKGPVPLPEGREFSLIPTDADMKRGEEDVKRAGWKGELAAGATEIGAQVAPIMKGAQVLQQGAKYLPKALQFAVPAAADVAANVGVGAATAPENKEEAAKYGALGSLGGRVLTKAIGATKTGLGTVKNFLSPEKEAAERIAKHLGPEGFEAAGKRAKAVLDAGDVENAPTSAVSENIPSRVSPMLKKAIKYAGWVAAFKSSGASLIGNVAWDAMEAATKKKVNQAIADPELFLKMVEAKKARGEALEAWEKKVANGMYRASVAGGAAGREAAEE